MQPASIDLYAMVAAKPWKTVAIAFAFGAGIALAHGARSRLGRAMIATAGSAVVSTLRELAAQHVKSYARSWLDEPAQHMRA